MSFPEPADSGVRFVRKLACAFELEAHGARRVGELADERGLGLAERDWEVVADCNGIGADPGGGRQGT